MQLLQNAKSQFIDANGAPLASGTVGFYFPGTLNPKSTYQDQAGTIANTNPVLLDSRGQAIIWGTGSYRQIVKDASGVTIWDQIADCLNAGTGDMRVETFLSGAGFTPGTTTTLTLSGSYGSTANVWVDFDGTPQHDFTLNGNTLTFPAAIPVGVSAVYVKGGTTASVGMPANGSVSDATVATSSKLYNRISDQVSVTDYGRPVTTTSFASAVSAVAGSGGGSLRMGRNSAVNPPADYGSVLLDYDGPNAPFNMFGYLPGETGFLTQKLFAYQENSAHLGTCKSAMHVQMHPFGTGDIGQSNSDVALTVSCVKQNFGSTTQAGELGGVHIGVRNGGPNSDAAGILANVGNYGVGFNCFSEANTYAFSGASITHGVNTQIGVVDTRTNNHVGFNATAVNGTLNGAFLAQHAGGTWTSLLTAVGQGAHAGIIFDMPIDVNQRVTMRLYDGTGGRKTVRANANSFSIMNAAESNEVFNVDDGGNSLFAGQVTSSGFKIGAILMGGTTSTTATAGGAALPATPAGFVSWLNGATTIKIPYYNA